MQGKITEFMAERQEKKNQEILSAQRKAALQSLKKYRLNIAALEALLSSSINTLSPKIQLRLFRIAYSFYQVQQRPHVNSKNTHPFERLRPAPITLDYVNQCSHYITSTLTPAVIDGIFIAYHRQKEEVYTELLKHTLCSNEEKQKFMEQRRQDRLMLLQRLRQRLLTEIQGRSVDERNHFLRCYIRDMNDYLDAWDDDLPEEARCIALYSQPEDHVSFKNFRGMNFSRLDLTRVCFLEKDHVSIITKEVSDITDSKFKHAKIKTEQLFICKGFSTIQGIDKTFLLKLQELKFDQLTQILNKGIQEILDRTEMYLDALSTLLPQIRDDHLQWINKLEENVLRIVAQILLSNPVLNISSLLLNEYVNLIDRDIFKDLSLDKLRVDIKKLLWNRGGTLPIYVLMENMRCFIEFNLEKDLESMDVLNAKEWLDELTFEQHVALKNRLVAIEKAITTQREKITQLNADTRQRFIQELPKGLRMISKSVEGILNDSTACQRFINFLLVANKQSANQNIIVPSEKMCAFLKPAAFSCQVKIKAVDKKEEIDALLAKKTQANTYLLIDLHSTWYIAFLHENNRWFFLEPKQINGLKESLLQEKDEKKIEQAIATYHQGRVLKILSQQLMDDGYSLLEGALSFLKKYPDLVLDLREINLKAIALKEFPVFDPKEKIDKTKMLDFCGQNVLFTSQQIFEDLLEEQRQAILDEFHQAIETGNLVVIKRYQAMGMDLDYVDKNTGRTPLMAACMKKQVAVARYFLEQGAKVDRPIERMENGQHVKKQRAFDTACRQIYLDKNYQAVVDLLIEYGATINLRNAIALNDIDRLKALWLPETDVTEYDLSHDETLVQCAIANHAHDVLKFLLEKKDAIHARNHKGQDAIQFACDWGNVEAVKILCGKEIVKPQKKLGFLQVAQDYLGAITKPTSMQLDATEPSEQKALQIAAQHYEYLKSGEPERAKDYLAIIEFLVNEKKVLIDLPTALKVNMLKQAKQCITTFYHHTFSGEQNILHLCAEYGEANLVDYILKKRTTKYLHQVDSRGYTPLLLACRRGHIETVKRLLDAGAQANQANIQPALHVAIVARQLGVVKILLEREVDGKSRYVDKEARWMERTALHQAVLQSSHSIISELLNVDVDINATWPGPEEISISRTALRQAIEQRDIESVALLLQHRANVLIPDEKGNLVFHYAVKGKHLSILKLLFKAIVSYKNNDLETPLSLAEKTSFSEITTFLNDFAEISELKPTMLSPINSPEKEDEKTLITIVKKEVKKEISPKEEEDDELDFPDWPKTPYFTSKQKKHVISTRADGNCAFNAMTIGVCRLLLAKKLPETFALKKFIQYAVEKLKLISDEKISEQEAFVIWLEKENPERWQIELSSFFREMVVKHFREHELAYQDLFISRLNHWFHLYHFNPKEARKRDDTFLVHLFIEEAFKKFSPDEKGLDIWWNEEGKNKYLDELSQTASSANDRARWGSDIEIEIITREFEINVYFKKPNWRQWLGIQGGCISLIDLEKNNMELLTNQGIGEVSGPYFCLHRFGGEKELEAALQPLSSNLQEKVNLAILSAKSKERLEVEDTSFTQDELQQLVTRHIIDKNKGIYRFVSEETTDKKQIIAENKIHHRMTSVIEEDLQVKIKASVRYAAPSFIVKHRHDHWEYQETPKNFQLSDKKDVNFWMNRHKKKKTNEEKIVTPQEEKRIVQSLI